MYFQSRVTDHENSYLLKLGSNYWFSFVILEDLQDAHAFMQKFRHL